MSRFLLPVAVFFILKKENKVLLLKRAPHLCHPNLYGFPGGGVEKGEGILEAASREAFEELDIDLSQSSPSISYSVYDREIKSGFSQIEFYLQYDSWKGEIKNKEPEKHSDCNFFDLNDLPSPMFDVTMNVLQNIQQGTHQLDFIS